MHRGFAELPLFSHASETATNQALTAHCGYKTGTFLYLFSAKLPRNRLFRGLPRPVFRVARRAVGGSTWLSLGQALHPHCSLASPRPNFARRTHGLWVQYPCRAFQNPVVSAPAPSTRPRRAVYVPRARMVLRPRERVPIVAELLPNSLAHERPPDRSCRC